MGACPRTQVPVRVEGGTWTVGVLLCCSRAPCAAVGSLQGCPCPPPTSSTLSSSLLGSCGIYLLSPLGLSLGARGSLWGWPDPNWARATPDGTFCVGHEAAASLGLTGGASQLVSRRAQSPSCVGFCLVSRAMVSSVRTKPVWCLTLQLEKSLLKLELFGWVTSCVPETPALHALVSGEGLGVTVARDVLHSVIPGTRARSRPGPGFIKRVSIPVSVSPSVRQPSVGLLLLAELGSDLGSVRKSLNSRSLFPPLRE